MPIFLLSLLGAVGAFLTGRDRKKTVVTENGNLVEATIKPDGSKKVVTVAPTQIPDYLRRPDETGTRSQIVGQVIWIPPPEALIYLDAIDQAERDNKIPHNLLARLLYQESRYRQDIISGKKKSSAGAIGIAQIVPRWHPDLKNPTNAWESIDYAAKYLADLYKTFGSWELALRAYNWGPGNIKNWLKKGADDTDLPRETYAYSNEILSDVPVTV